MHIKNYLDPDMADIPIDFESVFARSTVNLLLGACFPPDDTRRLQVFCLSQKQAWEIADATPDIIVWEGRQYRFGSFIFWNDQAVEVGKKEFNAFMRRISQARQK